MSDILSKVQPNAVAIIDMQRSSVVISRSTETNPPQVMTFEWTESSNPWMDLGRSIAWFNSVLEQAAIRDCKVAISLPRSSICLHTMELPKVPDSQLPEIVAVQLEQQYHDKFQSIVYDIVKLPSTNSSTTTSGRQVVVVGTAPKELVSKIEETCNVRNLEIVRLSCIDLVLEETNAIAENVEPSIRPSITVYENRLNISLALGSQILQSQVMTLEKSLPSASTLRGRIRLLEAGVPESLKSLPPADGVCLISNESVANGIQEVAVDLRMKQVIVDFHRLFATERSRLGEHNLDFVHRWKPSASKIAWKRLGFVSAILTATVLLALGIQSARRERLSQKLRELRAQLASTRDQIDSLAEYQDKWEQLHRWQESKHSWGQELVDIAKQSARFHDAYVSRVQFESPEGEQPSVIRLEGRSRTVTDAISWNRFDSQLANRYSIVPHSIESSVADPGFPIQFRTEVILSPVSQLGDSE